MNRTIKQNKAYWKWLELLADELNNSGQSMGDGVLIRLPLHYNKDSLHERVVLPYLEAQFSKESTTELSTVEMQDLYQNLDQIIAERSGCHVEWPDRFNQGGE